MKDRKEDERERKAGAVPAWSGRAAGSGPAPAWHSAAGAGASAAAQLARSGAAGSLSQFMARLTVAVLAPAVPRAMLFGLALASAAFVLVKISEYGAPRDSRPKQKFAFPASRPIVLGQLRDAVRNEGLMGRIPDIYSLTDAPATDSIRFVVKPAGAPAEAEPAKSREPDSSREAGPAGQRAPADAPAEALAMALKRARSAKQGLRLASLPRETALRSGWAGQAGWLEPRSGPAWSRTGPANPAARADRLSPPRRRSPALSSRTLRAGQARSNRAMGQLRLAQDMSLAANSASGADLPAAYAADAFDQQGALPAAAAAAGGGVPSAGASLTPGPGGAAGPGAPAPSSALVGSGQPIPNPAPVENNKENVTPWQKALDQAKELSDKARQLKKQGVAFIVLGLALMALGAYLLLAGITAAWGAVLLAAGLAMLVFGMEMVKQAKQSIAQAKEICREIGQGDGQNEQARRLCGYADAADKGEDWKPDCPAGTVAQVTDDPHQPYACVVPGTTVHDDVEREQQSTYSLQGGEGTP